MLVCDEPSIGEKMNEAFDRLLGELRPKLHRYCACMTGSVIDGEDALQEALVKAIEAHAGAGPIANPEGWLFRIAHNAALDFLRRRARRDAAHADADVDMIVDPVTVADARQSAASGLRTFMRLPVGQRSSVILMDVLGHTIEEVAAIIDSTIPAVKASLHRGRARLRELASEPDDHPVPMLGEPERARLAVYVDRFNARDFDAVRAMLAEDVRLELVNRLRLTGRKDVDNYFHNYARVEDWRFALGRVDRCPAVLVYDPADASGRPKYFVVLEWAGGKIVNIRDFLFARYAIKDAELAMLQ